MQASLAKYSLFLACAGALLIASPAAAAPIFSNGDQVSARFEADSTVYAGPVVANVVIGGGPEISSFPDPNLLEHSDGILIDFESDTIKIDVVELYHFSNAFTFNGLIFAPVNPAAIPDFTNVFIISPPGSLSGFDNSRISFTGNSISLNFAGLVFDPDSSTQSVTIQIQAASAEVPEPASLALWSAAAIGLGLARWRRRK
jgi:hypothetical protein